MARNTELFESARRYSPNVTFALGPHALYSVSVESLKWLKEFSDRHGIMVHMHLCETEDETRFTNEKYGMSPAEFLDSLGLLSRRFVGAHGCWLTHNDVTILRRTGANLVNNPVSNLKLSVGRVFPYRLVSENGVPFCLGTDGCSSNNHLDMMETMKCASLVAKFSTNDPTFLSARETVGRATTSAGRIFSLGTWEIAEGAAPDILLIDLERPEFVPNFDSYSDIVYTANGYAVDTVICMGRVVMEHRHVEGEEEIMARARTIARGLARR
jgi:5-methylthioadenosine/S-adenosylhomocysteine deaminase